MENVKIYTVVRYIMILDNKAKYVEMAKDDSSEKYAKVQKEFAAELRMTSKWTNVVMFRLHNDQLINGIYYEESYCVDGVNITLLNFGCAKTEDIEKAKQELANSRDVVSFEVLNVEPVLKNIAVQTTNGELTLLCSFDGVERAKKIAEKAHLDIEDIYEVRDDELEYYLFDGTLYDLDLAQIF